MVSRLWQQFTSLITAGDVRISQHGYDALADDGLTVDELESGLRRGQNSAIKSAFQLPFFGFLRLTGKAPSPT